MLVLGIETSTPASSVCLATEQGLVAEAAIGVGLNRAGGRGPAGRARGASPVPARGRVQPGEDERPASPRADARTGGRVQHGEFVAPAIAFCLEQAGVDVTALSGVAVCLGPGLYTGMRVGIATAQALAHARRLPMVGLASLDLLAFPVRHVRRLICSVLDARRGELFYALYRSAPGGVQRVSEFRCGPPAKLAGEIEAVADDVLCIGDGAVLHRSLLESAGAEVGSASSASPTAWALVELALPRFIREETQRPEDLQPTYLRQADARISWTGRGRLAGGKSPDHGDAVAAPAERR